MGWLASIIIGALVGWLAGRIMNSSRGVLGNILIGWLGSLVGNVIADLLNISTDGMVDNIVLSLIGACLLLWIFGKKDSNKRK